MVELDHLLERESGPAENLLEHVDDPRGAELRPVELGREVVLVEHRAPAEHSGQSTDSERRVRRRVEAHHHRRDLQMGQRVLDHERAARDPRLEQRVAGHAPRSSRAGADLPRMGPRTPPRSRPETGTPPHPAPHVLRIAIVRGA